MTVSHSTSPILSPDDVQVANEECPWCGQSITREQLEDIQARVRAEERHRTDAIQRQLTEEFALQKADVEAKAKAELEAQRREASVALEKARHDAKVKETVLRNQMVAEAERLKQDTAAKEAAAREMGKKAAELELAGKVAAAEQAKRTAEERAKQLQADQEKVLAESLHQQREALEKASAEAMNAEKAKAFEESLKMQTQLEEMSRQLQKKTSDELGEGAEVDLLEALKQQFPHDKIKRVPKGTPGADIIHEVIHKRRSCGTIVYDSKNHKAWRGEHVTKLRGDQIAAKADHAVLSSSKFPTGARQLHVVDGVIVANPARVPALAEILRRHMVQTFELRITNEERTAKTEALYSFMTSDQFSQLFSAIDVNLEKLERIDVDEVKSHNAVWAKRGKLIKDSVKVQAKLRFELDRITGTAGEEP